MHVLVSQEAKDSVECLPRISSHESGNHSKKVNLQRQARNPFATSHESASVVGTRFQHGGATYTDRPRHVVRPENVGGDEVEDGACAKPLEKGPMDHNGAVHSPHVAVRVAR